MSAAPSQPEQSGSHKDEQISSAVPEKSPQLMSTPTMSSEDSDTVILNSSSHAKTASESTTQTERPPPPSRASTLGIKKCWICICDSTEDDPINPPVWRSPCTCNLTAHEECLLDWVADLENPKKDKKKAQSKILCPQCKSEIKIARPRSYILDGYRALDRTLSGLVLPGLGASLFTTIFAGAWWHGFYSVGVVFGEEDARKIFEEALSHRGWQLAYALVPLNLVFARTTYADFVLPTGSLFLLQTQIRDNFEIDMTVWPPLPGTVFACLPAVKSAYQWIYKRAFDDLNKKWMQEIQPRQEMPEGQERNIADIANAQEEAEGGEGGLVLQLEVNLGAEEVVEDELVVRENEGAQGAEEGAENDENNANNENQGNADGQQQNGHVHQILGERGGEIVEGTSGFTQTFLGALAFPAIAAGMGGLLSYAVPSNWMTSTNLMNGRPGLLRHRWGRSVVGGCLFVVLKDALILYCRWRLARGHRERRIMDYDKVAKKYILS